MKTKIGLFSGLALVMFIGVFTTMLALGSLTPQRAEAQDLDATLDSLVLTEFRTVVTDPINAFEVSSAPIRFHDGVPVAPPGDPMGEQTPTTVIFDPAIQVYQATVHGHVTHVTVTEMVSTGGTVGTITPADALTGAGNDGHQVEFTVTEPTQTVEIPVTENGTTRTYELTITRTAPDTDRSLTMLRLDGISLSPTFNTNSFVYSAEVPVNFMTRTTVSLEKSDTTAVTYTPMLDAATGVDGHQVTIGSAPVTIIVRVHSETVDSGTAVFRDHTIVVTRVAAGNDATGMSLTLAGVPTTGSGILTPAFTSGLGTTEFTATVPFSVNQTRVTIVTNQAFAAGAEGPPRTLLDLDKDDADTGTGDKVHISLKPATPPGESAPTTTNYLSENVSGRKTFRSPMIPLATPGEHTITIELKHGTGDVTYTVKITRAVIERTDYVQNATVTNTPADPGARTQIRVQFDTQAELRAGQDTINLDIDPSFGIPRSISRDQVTISATSVTDPDGPTGDLRAGPNQAVNLANDPVYRLIPDEEGRVLYTIRVPDMDERDVSGVENILPGATVTIIFSIGAGFTNPTEASSAGDDFTISTNHQADTTSTTAKGSATKKGHAVAEVYTKLQLTVDDKAANRDKALTVIGKGYKNGTTITVWLDQNRNGVRDSTSDETILYTGVVESDDTFQATFSVTVPPFKTLPTTNYINATDGEANVIKPGEAYEPKRSGAETGDPAIPAKTYDKDDIPSFVVEGLLQVSPSSVGIGDKLTIKVVDWPHGGSTPYSLTIGGVNHNPGNRNTVTIPSTSNTAEFEVTVLDDVAVGTQQVAFGVNSESDTVNVVISGSDLAVTPTTLVPNQLMSVTGRSFTGTATINRSEDGSEVTMGGSTVVQSKIANGETVNVDNGGNWSASIVVNVDCLAIGNLALDNSASSHRHFAAAFVRG